MHSSLLWHCYMLKYIDSSGQVLRLLLGLCQFTLGSKPRERKKKSFAGFLSTPEYKFQEGPPIDGY